MFGWLSSEEMLLQDLFPGIPQASAACEAEGDAGS
jgi:hypothetical protein